MRLDKKLKAKKNPPTFKAGGVGLKLFFVNLEIRKSKLKL